MINYRDMLYITIFENSIIIYSIIFIYLIVFFFFLLKKKQKIKEYKNVFILFLAIIIFLRLANGIFKYFHDQWENPVNIDNATIDSLYTWFSSENSWYMDQNMTDRDKFELMKKENPENIISIWPFYTNFTLTDSEENKKRIQKYLSYAKYIIKKWKISDGYLYVKANANWWMLSSKESLYVILTRPNLGGHLMKNKSLIINTSDKEYIELLYKLNDIPLTKLPYNDNNDYASINWLKALNENQYNDSLWWFLSTNRKGQIEEITIVYK